ncbi:hypothetical protein [Patulibacter minatonensis]|uniref:hypothetical protein n=1 Tax=Patulibacter minatonensis TaxID=298163 RepID=UPI00047BF6D4|nr:hypothetical protein [Patulibacter minatonensis]
MAKQQQRQMRIEQRGGLAAIQELEQRSDADLLRESKNRSAARAILGSRAAERYDAAAARGYFQEAMAAARPQERPQIRRMAEAALALADRRSGDLKAAAQRLGQEGPSGRQLFLLRLSGLLVPPSSQGGLARARGVLLIILLLLGVVAIGTGLSALISWPLGGLSLASNISLGVIVLIVVIGVLIALARKRTRQAEAKRAEQVAQQRQPTNRAARRRG